MRDRSQEIEVRRREFLRATAGFGVLGFSLPFASSLLASAAAEDAGAGGSSATPTLVAIYLRGGMDALNVIVPHGDPRYYEIRPSIAVPAEDDEEGAGVIKTGKYFGLHPSLAPLMPHFEEGRMAAIMNVGSPHATRSHFDAQDFMEYAAPGLRTIKDGWLNRYLALTREKVRKAAAHPDGDLRALAMQGLLPRSLRGEHPVLAVPSDSVLDSAETLDLFEEIYGKDGAGDSGEMEGNTGDPGERSNDSVVATGQVTLASLERYRSIIREPAEQKDGVSYPPGALGVRLGRLARVLKAGAGLEVACVDVPGWDHHYNEGGNQGTLARMLDNLARSLAAFMTDLGPRLDSTVIMTMTEFGRTCRENGNYGTDHGHGGAMLVMGGGIEGGKIHGTWTGLTDAALYESRDLPVTTDFRDVFAEILLRHHGAKLPAEFFPGYRPKGMRGLFG